MFTYPIYVVDGDRHSRAALANLLATCGWQSRSFANEEDLFASESELRPGIILLLQTNGISRSFALLSHLQERGIAWPMILLAEGVAVSEAVAAMKLGALDVIERPVEAPVLVRALDAASEKLDLDLQTSASRRDALRLVAELSDRELEVLRGLLAGYSNKTMAELTCLSVRTMEMHRGRILDRMGVESIVGAIRIALEAGLQPLHRKVA